MTAWGITSGCGACAGVRMTRANEELESTTVAEGTCSGMTSGCCWNSSCFASRDRGVVAARSWAARGKAQAVNDPIRKARYHPPKAGSSLFKGVRFGFIEGLPDARSVGSSHTHSVFRHFPGLQLIPGLSRPLPCPIAPSLLVLPKTLKMPADCCGVLLAVKINWNVVRLCH